MHFVEQNRYGTLDAAVSLAYKAFWDECKRRQTAGNPVGHEFEEASRGDVQTWTDELLERVAQKVRTGRAGKEPSSVRRFGDVVEHDVPHAETGVGVIVGVLPPARP